MRNIGLTVAAIILSLTLALNPSEAQYQKAKIAILDFQLQGSGFETEDMGKIVAEWLITALVKDGRFDVVERNLLEIILAEQKLSSTGVIDANSAARIGRILGVKIIISGSVIKFRNVLEVNARIINVESASIIAAENVKSTTAVRLEDLVVQMADKIIRDFPLEGYIVKRKGEEVTVDLGKRAGVKQGMRFIVFKEGSVIKHPKTGEVLEVEMIETGIIEIASIGNNIAKANIVEEESKNAIKYGQQIKSAIETERPIGKYSQPEKSAITATGIVLSHGPTSFEEANTLIDDASILKKAGDPNWKTLYRAGSLYIKKQFKINKKSPEANFYYSKLYIFEGKYKKALNYLNASTNYNDKYYEAFKLKGDICYEWGKPRPRGWKKIVKWGVQAYTTAAIVSNDNAAKAMANYNIGNMYSDIAKDNSKAMEYWNKAIDLAGNSEAAKLAAVRIK